MKQAQHSRAFFALAGSTKPKIPVRDNCCFSSFSVNGSFLVWAHVKGGVWRIISQDD